MAVPVDERPLTVLLVDDHQMVAEGLSMALAGQGLAVLGRAATLDEGVRLAGELRPAVVLLDFRLPDGDALDGIPRLNEVVPDAFVVVLTAVADERTAADVLSSGAAGYLTKDLPIAELVAGVQAAARGEVAVPPALMARVLRRLRGPDLPSGASLSERELETLTLLADGSGVDGVAAALFISRNTARKHVQAVLTKLNAHSQLEAVAIARKAGLLRD